MALNFKPGSVVKFPNGDFDCEIWLENYGKWVPTTCSARDVNADQRDLYIRLSELTPGEVLTAPEPDPAAILQAERATMVCSPLQGRLVLGPDVCAAVDALADDPTTPWAMRETIKRAIVWERTSQSMDELAYLLGYTPEEMDALFRIAMNVHV